MHYAGYARFFFVRSITVVKFILGEKLEMSQVFDESGRVTPVTIVRATPNMVLQVKTQERDGYAAIAVGFGERKARLIPKPQRGFFAGSGNFRYVREFRAPTAVSAASFPEKGVAIDVTVFAQGDAVKVSSISKAKGFQGVVKRYGFHGAPATHGTKHAHRQPGSIGGAGGRAGGRVAKGMRMAGRMGGRRISARNLKIVRVDPNEHLLEIKGAIPGRRGTLVEIRGV